MVIDVSKLVFSSFMLTSADYNSNFDILATYEWEVFLGVAFETVIAIQVDGNDFCAKLHQEIHSSYGRFLRSGETRQSSPLLPVKH